MGRETKILLALLGLLVGVFLGVVSMKLFVPRPPVGVGPDVHADLAVIEAQATVEPPDFTLPPAAIDVAADPLPQTRAAEDLPDPGRTSRFGGGDPIGASPRDPFVTPASFEIDAPPASPPATDLLPPPATDLLPPPASDVAPPSAIDATTATLVESPPHLPLLEPAAPPSFERRPPATANTEIALADTYVAQAGDSWWSVAERVYGDGRLYRALFAWNRMLDPRVSLAPGTKLETPPAFKLGAAWPALLPRD